MPLEKNPFQRVCNVAIQKAVETAEAPSFRQSTRLKPGVNERGLRDHRGASNLAKRLECGWFTAAFTALPIASPRHAGQTLTVGIAFVR